MAESSTADLMSVTEKENFDRLMSLFRTGTEIKQRLLEYYISKKELNLIDWLSVLSNNFLQSEDVKRAHRRSSTVQSTDLGDNTINTVLMCYCFEMFWDCCLLDTCLEGFLNTHKYELYRSYVNSQKQTELPSVSSAPYSTSSPENNSPIITKDQWEFLFKNDENEKCLLASNGITVSCLDSYQNIFILSIVCSLFKAVKAVSECQIQISKIAALQGYFSSNEFLEIWTKMEEHIVTIGKNCANSDIFQSKCARIRKTTYSRSLVQENRKYILQEALNSPSFIRDRDFCECVRKELDLITDEENLNLARKLCGSDISVTLDDGKYRKGAYSLSVIENADNDLQKLISVCSKPVISTSQTETEEKTQTDDLQERINKHNYLKLVQLITHIAKNVLVDVLKRRLPATNLGIAFNGMKNRILPLLNNQERQVLYPDNSYYKGDLSDLDISLIYTILRNLNNLRPHKTSWGNMPKDDDRDMSANIERIRIFKNIYVSHHPTNSLNAETFDKTWTEISACIIELGGTEYSIEIDYLLTSEINPVMEKELFNTIERVKEADRQHQIHMNNLQADLDEIKEQLNRITLCCATRRESSAMVPLELKIEGDDIPSVQEIKKCTKTFESEYALIKSTKEGSIIICLDVASSALSSLGLFLEVIETLLSTVLQRKHKYDDGSTSFVIISLDFMDKNNEPLVYRKTSLDMVKLIEEEQPKRFDVETIETMRQKFDLCWHHQDDYLNDGNSLCTLQTEHVYVSPNKKRERRKGYEKPRKFAKLLIEDGGSLMAKMSNVENMVQQTTVDNFTSAAARITPKHSDKSVPERVQIKQEPKSGIDEVIPADSWSTTKRDGTVKIRMGTKGNQADQPVTLITVFKKTSERAPNHLALAVKRDSIWKKWTYKQYYADVCAAAKSFIKLGLEAYHGVGILGFNSPEWLISDLGCIFAGGFATGIYATNTPEAVEYVAKHSEANVLVVENNQQLQKILKVWPNLPCLRAVVQYTGEVAERKDNVYSWEEFMKVGKDVTDQQLQERINLARPNKCCTLIYTSGTTGDPKGVMLSHDNATWTASCISKLFELNFGSEVLASYLPLSHIAAQLNDILIPVRMASAVYFAQPDALKGSLLGTLQEVRPTGFFGVPRVWEKFYEGIKIKARSSGALKKKIGMWAKGVGLKGSHAMMNKQSMPFGWGLANTLVFKKAKTALGLDRCRFFMSGAAPIMKETLEFFYSLNMQLHEVYGMSESTGPHTVGCNEDFKICSVGHNFPGSETKLANPDEDGNGEICMWGRHVFMGYLNAPEKNNEIFDEENWLKTGDLGKHDAQGFLFITGRIKELIITAGGENIAPVPMEDAVKEALPCINNCMLIGDKRKFLSMILCLKVDVDADTAEPSNNLTTDCKDWCKSIGSQATTVEDIIDKKDAVVLKAIQDGIDRANAKSVSRAAKVQKWSIIPRDFSIPGGELGPTLKLRRPVVTKMYKKTIDAFYTEAEEK